MFFRWLELRSGLEAPPAQLGHYSAGVGIRPSPHCARCGADAVQWREDPLTPLRPALGDPGSGAEGSASATALYEPAPRAVLESRCRRCLSPWLLELVSFCEYRGPSRVQRLSEVEQLGRVLETLSTAERRLYLQLYLLEGSAPLCAWLQDAAGNALGLSYDLVAREANRRWPLMHPAVRPSGPRAREWSRWTIGNVVADARARIVDGMSREGLWRYR